jgi:hypothetical protein
MKKNIPEKDKRYKKRQQKKESEKELKLDSLTHNPIV